MMGRPTSCSGPTVEEIVTIRREGIDGEWTETAAYSASTSTNCFN